MTNKLEPFEGDRCLVGKIYRFEAKNLIVLSVFEGTYPDDEDDFFPRAHEIVSKLLGTEAFAYQCSFEPVYMRFAMPTDCAGEAILHLENTGMKVYVEDVKPGGWNCGDDRTFCLITGYKDGWLVFVPDEIGGV